MADDGNNGQGNKPLPVPGLDWRSFQDGPSTWGEFLRDWAASVSRDSAPYQTIFARSISLDADSFEHVIARVTDHPETTGFHIRIEASPLAPAGTVFRVLVNFSKQLSASDALETFVAANGGIFLPGYVDDFPVMRARVEPITVDVVRVGGVPGELAEINIQIYELRRVAFQPRSKGRARPVPNAEKEQRRIGKPTRPPAQQVPMIGPRKQ